jgi:hypothetical protein
MPVLRCAATDAFCDSAAAVGAAAVVFRGVTAATPIFSGAVAEPVDAFVERRSLMPLRERVVRSGSGESPGDGMPPGGPVDLS